MFIGCLEYTLSLSRALYFLFWSCYAICKNSLKSEDFPSAFELNMKFNVLMWILTRISCPYLLHFNMKGCFVCFHFWGIWVGWSFGAPKSQPLYEILTKYNGLVRDVFLLSSLGFCTNVKWTACCLVWLTVHYCQLQLGGKMAGLCFDCTF